MTFFLCKPIFFSMSDEPTKLINKRGIAYQCMTCGKVDQRHRLKTHIYKEHVERGNVPYLCSICSFFWDTYASLAKHLVHEVHSNYISLYGGDSHNTNNIHLSTVLERRRNTCKKAIIMLPSRRRSGKRLSGRGPVAVVGTVRG